MIPQKTNESNDDSFIRYEKKEQNSKHGLSLVVFIAAVILFAIVVVSERKEKESQHKLESESSIILGGIPRFHVY